MPVVVDANAFWRVFDKTNAEHAPFSIVKDWVTEGNGKLVYGGTRYSGEVGGERLLRLLRQLSDARRLIKLNNSDVDERAAWVEHTLDDKRCDDPHIIAMLGVSRCSLLCSLDGRASAYIKRRDLYPPGMSEVRIFTGRGDQRHLLRENE